MATEHPVYTGFWTNWAEGQTFGATLTLSARNGAYLVALLALFVRIAGGHLWSITGFAVFRLRSSSAVHDGLFLQHQAVLRNNSSDSGALWEFLRSAVHWRGRVDSPIPRSLGLAALAVLNIAAFAIAGVFSSRAASTNSQVLLAPTTCGAWPFLDQIDSSESYSFQHDILSRASRLAPLCYNSTSLSYNGTQTFPSPECTISGRHLIQWNMSDTNNCPFDSSLCAGNTVVILDSGYVDSLYDLGINGRPENRLIYRQTSICTPLEIRDHLTGFQAPNSTLIGPNYQPNKDIVWNSLRLGANLVTNGSATFSFSNASLNYNALILGSAEETQAYIVDVEEYHVEDTDSHYHSTFTPIPRLEGNDTVTSVMILINSAGYAKSVDDPWFNATRFNGDKYTSEQIIQALGCSSQYFICTPQKSGEPLCGRLSSLSNSLPDVGSSSEPIAFNAVQKSMLPRFTSATSRNAMPRVPQFLGADSLLTSSYLYQWSSLPLQDDQWILELSNWFSTSLIALQLFSTSYVQTSSPQWDMLNTKKNPPAADQEWMCSNQIVRRDDYTSFNVLSLAIIIGIGCLIIIVNLTIKRLVKRLQPKTPKNLFRSQDWTTQGTLQLQRLAYEKHGLGHWEGDGDFPLTSPGERFSPSMDTFEFHRIPQADNENSILLTNLPLSPEAVMERVANAPEGSENDQIWGPVRNANLAVEDRRRSHGFGWR